MKKYKYKSAPTKQGAYIRRRVAKNRHRAEFVGVIYLFATIALAALACLPMLDSAYAPVGIQNIMTLFGDKIVLETTMDVVKLVNAALYVLMLLGLFINIIRSLANLSHLFKKKVSRVYGLNANLDAMESMGVLFSGSFASVINFHFLIYIFADKPNLTSNLVIAAVLGLAVHFLCGFWSTKLSVFEKDAQVGIIEHKRAFSRALPIFRNVLQFVAVCAMLYFFLFGSTLGNYVHVLFAADGVNKIAENYMYCLPFVLQLLAAIWLMVLVKHATGVSEYDFRGPEAEGQHNHRIFSFLTALTAGAIFACRYMLGEATFSQVGETIAVTSEQSFDMYSLVIAGVAFVSFLLDCIFKLRFAEEEEPRRIVYPMMQRVAPTPQYVMPIMPQQAQPYAPVSGYVNAPQTTTYMGMQGQRPMPQYAMGAQNGLGAQQQPQYAPTDGYQRVRHYMDGNSVIVDANNGKTVQPSVQQQAAPTTAQMTMSYIDLLRQNQELKKKTEALTGAQYAPTYTYSDLMRQKREAAYGTQQLPYGAQQTQMPYGVQQQTPAVSYVDLMRQYREQHELQAQQAQHPVTEETDFMAPEAGMEEPQNDMFDQDGGAAEFPETEEFADGLAEEFPDEVSEETGVADLEQEPMNEFADDEFEAEDEAEAEASTEDDDEDEAESWIVECPNPDCGAQIMVSNDSHYKLCPHCHQYLNVNFAKRVDTATEESEVTEEAEEPIAADEETPSMDDFEA